MTAGHPAVNPSEPHRLAVAGDSDPQAGWHAR